MSTLHALHYNNNILHEENSTMNTVFYALFAQQQVGVFSDWDKAKKEQVELLAELLETDRKPLLTLWLADQIIDLVSTNEFALDAVRLAEKHLTQQEK